MASNSSSGSGTSTSIDEVMEQRKRKRMLSNRESARRSRQRKQKHLDDLNAQLSQLRKENGEVAAALSVTTQHYLGVEAENSVLRTQMMELSNRLQALNEILSCVNEGGGNDGDGFFYDDGMRPWSMMMGMANQPMMMASVDMYGY
ncbi:uncharacterized protein A4U43_C01F26970 [Asparagus officinalis]|uniref:BZIP domain-containing protein n=1 Tax=Asparagus officinalis TaxID=4686 RepID=A0A5P1FVQ7_ASPOF|nr:bZIP transcription factor 44-like [Asparagus officinalis]ONK81249.1 uncharacterized protein A4U43_C01F26970 [Asparagus officinalis]